jgi:hypothetical protein
MSSPRKPDAATLARYFPDLTTADKIPIPTPKPLGTSPRAGSLAETEEPRERWSKEKSHAFTLMAPYALYVAATDGPVSVVLYHPNGEVKKRFGHNRGVWPVRVSSTSSYKDDISRNIDKDPFTQIRVKRRIWVPTFTEVSRLVMEVGAILATAAEKAGFEPLLHDFIDAGPNFSKVDFERDILLVARALAIVAWTETALSAFLDKVIAAAREKGIEILDARGRKIDSEAFQRWVDQATIKEAQRQFPGRG